MGVSWNFALKVCGVEVTGQKVGILSHVRLIKAITLKMKYIQRGVSEFARNLS